ncbi:hypothetical protein SLS53_001762 [Cytospora paraplurivora]|uniref:Uncharacterized protein n=1 Tax=Cytospora paraplurivora TaxID=2898453 RepID=A0AAN9UIP5_9PEZI
MSNLVLNFDSEVGGEHVFKINTGMPVSITSAEEHFARIFFDIERLALPIYHDIVQAITTFARNDKASCAWHVASISAHLRPALNTYYERVHDKAIPISIWLSRVQGFFAWGAGRTNSSTGEWERFDGLSGNQILLFQVLDAFLGMEPYLSAQDLERTVPLRQRAFCKAVEKYSFRGKLNSPPNDDNEMQILRELDEIIKRLRVSLITMLLLFGKFELISAPQVFRSAHRIRSKNYLSQPAPERLPMTAGKSLLNGDMDQSLEFLDQFMIRRFEQTV